MPLSFITILRSDIDLGAILLGLEMFFLCLMIPLVRASWDDSPRPDFSAYVRRKPRRGDRVIRGGKKVSARTPSFRCFPTFRLPVRGVADLGAGAPTIEAARVRTAFGRAVGGWAEEDLVSSSKFGMK